MKKNLEREENLIVDICKRELALLRSLLTLTYLRIVHYKIQFVEIL